MTVDSCGRAAKLCLCSCGLAVCATVAQDADDAMRCAALRCGELTRKCQAINVCTPYYDVRLLVSRLTRLELTEMALSSQDRDRLKHSDNNNNAFSCLLMRQTGEVRSEKMWSAAPRESSSRGRGGVRGVVVRVSTPSLSTAYTLLAPSFLIGNIKLGIRSAQRTSLFLPGGCCSNVHPCTFPAANQTSATRISTAGHLAVWCFGQASGPRSWSTLLYLARPACRDSN